MGIQKLEEVALIRHAYVLKEHRRRGVGRKPLLCLINLAESPEILVGTWESAGWAIRFCETHGFKLVSSHDKDRLLREYRNIPKRQIGASLVLALNKR